MTIGKTLWLIIFIKLFVMFAVLKLFFFPNYLNSHYETDRQRADYVSSRLTLQVENNNELGGETHE